MGHIIFWKRDDMPCYSLALKTEKLIAFTKNDVGNAFWRRVGWTKREDLNYYDFVLNKENIVNYNK